MARRKADTIDEAASVVVESMERGAEIGPRQIYMAPYEVIVPFRQVREEIEQEPLDELKKSIRRIDEDGTITYNLVNPLVVAQLDTKHAEAYLSDLNALWKTSYTLDELPTDPTSGNYLFLIAGHRRLRAISELIREDGLDPSQVRIAVSPQQNIDFAEAIIIQMLENVYEKPPLTDEAEAIRASYDFFKGREPGMTKTAFAKRIRKSTDKVSNALKFSQLPQDVKSWVKNKDISFTLGVLLAGIQEEYVSRFDRVKREGLLEKDSFANAEEYAAYEIQTLAISFRAMMQRSRRMSSVVNGRAEEQLRTLRGQRKFVQDAFELVLEVVSAKERRRGAVKGLASSALRALEAALREDPQVLAAISGKEGSALALLDQALRVAESGVPTEPAELGLFN